MVFVWACGRKGRALAGEWDHLPTRSGFNRGPSLVVNLGLVGTRIRAGFCDHRWVGRELRLSRPAFASNSRQGAQVERTLTHACRQSSGAVRVIDVRIDWHVKRPTSNKVKRRVVQSQAGGGLANDNSRSSERSCSCWGAVEQRAAWSFCLRLQTPWGSTRVREMWRHRAQ